jgi:hypothetical protein
MNAPELIAAVVVTCGAIMACGGGRTALPNAATAPTTPLSVTFPIRLTGAVSDGNGASLSGATVTVQPFNAVPAPPPVTTTTDVAGRYDVSFMGNTDASVIAEHVDYERTIQFAGVAAGAATVTKNLRLYHVIRIAGGDSVPVVIRNDSSCGLEDEWICRIVRVDAPRAGAMTIEAVVDDPSLHPSIGLGSVAWPSIPQYPCCPASARVPVKPGDQVIADVMLPWTSAAGVILLRSSIE